MIRKGQAYGSAAGAKVGLASSPLHSRSVRGDELNCQSSNPIFGSTTKSQHIQTDSHGLADATAGAAGRLLKDANFVCVEAQLLDGFQG
jgi:hypothetical protein